jgi:hypothetical protein
MTKHELIKLLEPFNDSAEVFINLYTRRYPNGSQVLIQSVREQEPWRHGPLNLVALLAHADNKPMTPEEIDPMNLTVGYTPHPKHPGQKPGCHGVLDLIPSTPNQRRAGEL